MSKAGKTVKNSSVPRFNEVEMILKSLLSRHSSVVDPTGVSEKELKHAVQEALKGLDCVRNHPAYQKLASGAIK